ncbi:MAG: carboxypeptidase regulatory-like domain-containing protein [Chloroflexi bacterium]|nr:carboxypeptidase regulatory-like domain-containing protein [Chloroflexota bacterium]
MILKHRHFVWLPLALALALMAGLAGALESPDSPQPTPITGAVLTADGPLAGAVVRVQGQADYALTDAQGRFSLDAPASAGGDVSITASAAGMYIEQAVWPGSGEVTLTLRRHHTTDHLEYAFISPVLDPDHESACMRCHAARDSGLSLPVDEWLQDAHAGAAVNPRFLSFYNGTTLDGTTGGLTAYRFDAALGIDVPVAPSQGQSEAGVGFRLDFPDSGGNCAACHVPILALEAAHNADPNAATGVAAEGITCDFCHKIAGVRLGPDGLPSPHLPGVLSIDLLRPPEGEQIFIGPLDDSPGDDVYSPLQNQSQFCATCHTGTFWGVSIYNSFGEWLDSPYSDPETGQTCQDCHMPPLGMTTFVELPPDVTQHVPERDPATIFSHRMPGAADVKLLQNTAELTLDVTREGDSLTAGVTVTNSGAGHHIPTDNPLRNIILVVEARDADGQPLALVEGPTLPVWAGVGDPAKGYYAGLPGVFYAKILADFYTGETPAYAYWRQTRLVSDNRIPALGSDSSTYRFAAPTGSGPITVTARLLLRRAFIEVMDLKGWDTPDILMEEASRRVAE